MPVYCITGTNRGLGLEFVRQLAASHDNTILALTRTLSSDLTDLKAVSAASSKTHILECDTGSSESIQSFANEAKKLLSDQGHKIDVLINNAGINFNSWQSSLALEPDSLLHQIRINVIGPATTVQMLHAAGLLSPQVRVINLTSGLGSMAESLGPSGNTSRKCCGYSISKAGLNMLSVHQSGDLREKGGLPGAVVVVIDPGWVKTRMGGAGAVLEPEESIGRMLKVVGGLRDEDNGTFLKYNGERIPW